MGLLCLKRDRRRWACKPLVPDGINDWANSKLARPAPTGFRRFSSDKLVGFRHQRQRHINRLAIYINKVEQSLAAPVLIGRD